MWTRLAILLLLSGCGSREVLEHPLGVETWDRGFFMRVDAQGVPRGSVDEVPAGSPSFSIDLDDEDAGFVFIGWTLASLDPAIQARLPAEPDEVSLDVLSATGRLDRDNWFPDPFLDFVPGRGEGEVRWAIDVASPQMRVETQSFPPQDVGSAFSATHYLRGEYQDQWCAPEPREQMRLRLEDATLSQAGRREFHFLGTVGEDLFVNHDHVLVRLRAGESTVDPAEVFDLASTDVPLAWEDSRLDAAALDPVVLPSGERRIFLVGESIPTGAPSSGAAIVEVHFRPDQPLSTATATIVDIVVTPGLPSMPLRSIAVAPNGDTVAVGGDAPNGLGKGILLTRAAADRGPFRQLDLELNRTTNGAELYHVVATELDGRPLFVVAADTSETVFIESDGTRFFESTRFRRYQVSEERFGAVPKLPAIDMAVYNDGSDVEVWSVARSGGAIFRRRPGGGEVEMVGYDLREELRLDQSVGACTGVGYLSSANNGRGILLHGDAVYVSIEDCSGVLRIQLDENRDVRCASMVVPEGASGGTTTDDYLEALGVWDGTVLVAPARGFLINEITEAPP